MNRLVLSLVILMCSAPVFAGDFVWPNGAKAAVSLSYDDTLDSQLDNAVPTLNKHGIKASFYLLLASPVLYARLDEWRVLATQGHELGNHTIYHPCSASQPGNDWVRPHNDMDKRTVEHMRQEVFVANTFLKAIDGRTERTMTPPCGHLETSDGNYLPAVREFFVAIKGDESLPAGFSTYSVPSDISGEELIAFVQRAAENGGMANIIFHGIGGDHLQVASPEHEKLIRFLARHRDVYWTDTYLNIMKYLNAKMQKPRGGSE